MDFTPSQLNSSLPFHSLHIYYGFSKDFHPHSLIDQLAEDEKKRASQIRIRRDRNLYISSRALLRKLLANYLDIGIDQIQFEYGINGKPFVKGQSNIQFSIAHSKEVFLLGFLKNDSIGIDIEHLNRPIDTKKLLGFLLSENELAKFQSTDQKFHHEQFINCWTRKEAFLKAKGVGLSFPLSQLEVSFLKGEKAEILSTMWSEQEKLEWSLISFDIPGNYRGAVAIQGIVDSMEIKNVAEDKLLYNSN